MYFDLEDHRPDIAPVGRAISWREGVLLSIIGHLVMAIVLLVAPKYLPDPSATEARAVPPRSQEPMPSFVFVQPRVDKPAPKPPPRPAPPSDQDRQAMQLQRPPKPTNPMPFSRGNTSERVERSDERAARGRGPEPDPSPSPADAQPPGPPIPDSQSALHLPTNPQSPQAVRPGERAPAGGGRLGDALRNLGKYVQPDQFENAQGDSGAFGPAIQFDTKGVEFGPWIRRFIAQVKRNWLIPYAAMSMKGHVVVTFNVHKDGSISDLVVLGPSAIEAFNNAAYGALASSNPTQPLPPEYPVEKAFFTVTFFYNENPQ
jgi:TonB family protein